MSSASASISVVIVAFNEGALLRRTVEALEATAPAHTELVVIDDGSTDGCTDFLRIDRPRVMMRRTDRQGVARARNLGARTARGEYLVFTDAHVTPEHADWWSPLHDALVRAEVGAVAPAISVEGQREVKGYGFVLDDVTLGGAWLPRMGTAPYVVPALPGAFLAMRRDVFERVGGFDDGLLLFGFDDVELGLRLWLLGYQLLVVPQVTIAHHFRQTSPYQRDGAAFVHNRLRMARIHLGDARLRRVLDDARPRPGFAAGMALANPDEIAARRAALTAARVRSDDWFFDTFAPSTQRSAP